MTFVLPGKYLIQSDFINIRYYGLAYALAFIVCIILAKFLADQKYKYLQEKFYSSNSNINLNFTRPSYEEITDIAMWLIISGLIGARLWYVILDWNYYKNNLSQIFQIWLGGQSIQGGIVGALIGLIIYTKIFNSFSFQKLSFSAGIASCVVPLGQAIGRWGNFFNEEAYGPVMNGSKWYSLYISHLNEYHQPTFLYESFLNLLNFTILLQFYKRISGFAIFGLYILNYSIIRIILEEFRTDSLLLWGFKAASVISLLGIITGISLILIFKNKKQVNSN